MLFIIDYQYWNRHFVIMKSSRYSRLAASAKKISLDIMSRLTKDEKQTMGIFVTITLIAAVGCLVF